jgi:type IV secretion system protein VirB2
MKRDKHRHKQGLIHIVGMVLAYGATLKEGWAQTSGAMPWDGWLSALLANLTGPTVKTIAILLVMGLGLTFAASDGGVFRKAAGVLFGLSIAFAAASWAPGFLGYTGP